MLRFYTVTNFGHDLVKKNIKQTVGFLTYMYMRTFMVPKEPTK